MVRRGAGGINGEIMTALDQLERERGISKEDLIEAMEAALLSAYRAKDNEMLEYTTETGNKPSPPSSLSQVKDPERYLSW